MVTTSVMTIGMTPARISWVSHSTMPVQKTENIPKEGALVDFIFQVFGSWGRNAAVVKKPDARPIRGNLSIICKLAIYICLLCSEGSCRLHHDRWLFRHP